MKRFLAFLITAVIVTLLMGCNAKKPEDINDPVINPPVIPGKSTKIFSEKLEAFRERYTEYDNNRGSETYIQTDDHKYYLSDLLEVYDSRKSNLNNAFLGTFGELYYYYFDSVAEIFRDNLYLETNKPYVPSHSYFSVDFFFSVINDDRVVAKVPNKQDILEVGFTPTGQLIFKNFSYRYTNGKFAYDYQEYVEDNYWLFIDLYEDGRFNYSTFSQTEDTSFSFSILNPHTNVKYNIGWYDPETMIHTSIGLSQEDTIVDERYAFYNDLGTFFTYEPDDAGSTVCTWNLLEATGWDYYYYLWEGDWDVLPTKMIFKGETPILEGSNLSHDLSTKKVFLNWTQRFSPSQPLTDEFLNLSIYNLSFNRTDISLDYLAGIRTKAAEDYKLMTTFKGINFLSEDVRTQLFNSIDQEITQAFNKNI